MCGAWEWPKSQKAISYQLLYTHPSYPEYIQLLNVDVSGTAFSGVFQWNSAENALKLLTGEVEETKSFEIPVRTISVDGDLSDWQQEDRVIIDAIGDDEYQFPGDDIHEVYLAKDAEFIYFAVQMADGAPLSAPDEEGGIHFLFELTPDRHFSKLANHFVAFSRVRKVPPDVWSVTTEIFLSDAYSATGWTVRMIDAYPVVSHLGVGATAAEWKVSIKDLMSPIVGKYVNVWTGYFSVVDISDGIDLVRLRSK